MRVYGVEINIDNKKCTLTEADFSVDGCRTAAMQLELCFSQIEVIDFQINLDELLPQVNDDVISAIKFLIETSFFDIEFHLQGEKDIPLFFNMLSRIVPETQLLSLSVFHDTCTHKMMGDSFGDLLSAIPQNNFIKAVNFQLPCSAISNSSMCNLLNNTLKLCKIQANAFALEKPNKRFNSPLHCVELVNLSLDDEAQHAGIAKALSDFIWEQDDIEVLLNLANDIGIGRDKKPGDDNELSKLRCRKKLGMFYAGYRETNDSEAIANALFEKADALLDSLGENAILSEQDYNAYFELFNRETSRSSDKKAIQGRVQQFKENVGGLQELAFGVNVKLI